MTRTWGWLAVALLMSPVLVVTGAGAVEGRASTEPAAAAEAGARAPDDMAARRASRRRPALSASARQADEGDRLILTARVPRPRGATRITLQRWHVPPYVGTASWTPERTTRVRGRAKVVFTTVATAQNSERYRVLVSYRSGRTRTRTVASRVVAVTVWRWIPLSSYAPYYKTNGSEFGQVDINGRAYRGWGAAYYSHAGAWEGRFTPGRHCTAFRAVLGVEDISDDGSSAVITLTADDATVYRSPDLTPGTSAVLSLTIAKPYRFGIQLLDTSPDEAESWPVLGDPAFRCTGT